MDSVKPQRPPKSSKKALSASELAVEIERSVAAKSVSYDQYRKLEMQLEAAKQEIEELKSILSRSGAINLALPVSDEEEIASIQLEKIKKVSRERELSLEEIKKYDLLVKNKRLAQGDFTEINGNKSLPQNLEKKDLLVIATSKK